MDLTNLIGTAAAVLTTSCFIPQVWLILRHQKTEGISLLMYVIYLAGILTWYLYGVMLDSFPIILANGVSAVLVAIILGQKIRLG